VLLQFLFASGVRVSELVALRVKDLRFRDDGACVVSIYRKKTNKTTTQVYGSTSTITAALRELVDGRRAEDAVFRSTGVPASITSRSQQNVDGPLDPSAVLRIVKAAAKRAGIDKPVSTHWLRHSCATRLCEREQNLHNVASWLGHNSINTTQRYVHVLGDLDLSHHFA
jgi:integrase/recombinase XerD